MRGLPSILLLTATFLWTDPSLSLVGHARAGEPTEDCANAVASSPADARAGEPSKSDAQSGEPRQSDARESFRSRTEATAAEILPLVASLNGFEEHGPVKIEAWTKAEMIPLALEDLRTLPGADELKWSGRVLAEIGFWQHGFDLEKESAAVIVEVMGGGYDCQRKVFAAILDLPEPMYEPSVQRMVIAHELTHALQDQHGDMEAQQRKGVRDLDYAHTYNCVIEGMAYLTMMAVVAQTPLRQAPDPTTMLEQTRGAIESSPGYPAISRSPRLMREQIFGQAIQGVSFCRKWLEAHPDLPFVALLDNLPASGEQVLHYEKFVAGDRPTSIDLSGVAEGLPGDWRPYYESSLGEFAIRVLCESHETTRQRADSIAAGWDGCRIQAFEMGGGDLAVLGVSVWDTEQDAMEFQAGLRDLLTELDRGTPFEIRATERRVAFVVGARDAEASIVALDALEKAVFTSS